MRIGVIASPWIPVPPPAYGGTETVIHNLCVGLEALGHDVHLVTVGTSTCPVLLRSSVFEEPPAGIGDPIAEIVHARAAYSLLQDVDVIHDHTVVGPQFLPLTLDPARPVVTTVHGPFDERTRLMHATRPPGVAVVAISQGQRDQAPDIDVAAVIHHGIDLDLHRLGPGGGGYLMFVGRMCRDKGPDRAIDVARKAGRPIVLAAKMREPHEVAYFEEHVRPRLGDDVHFLGEADTATRQDLLRHADALVNPIRWPEPFGLVMAESLASGTPVLALRYGAAPEIVDDGRTGFVCDDEDQLADAVRRIGDIDRRACRAAAQERFSVQRMAADHAALYERLVGPRKRPPAPLATRPVAALADRFLARSRGTTPAADRAKGGSAKGTIAEPAQPAQTGAASPVVIPPFDARRRAARPDLTAGHDGGWPG